MFQLQINFTRKERKYLERERGRERVSFVYVRVRVTSTNLETKNERYNHNLSSLTQVNYQTNLTRPMALKRQS